MIDKIKLQIPPGLIPAIKAVAEIKEDWGASYWRGVVAGYFLVRSTGKYATLEGSVTKAAVGNNEEAITREKVFYVIAELLGQGLGLWGARVLEMEYGAGLVVKYWPGRYIRLYGACGRATQTVINPHTGITGASWNWAHEGVKLVMYDKGREARKSKQESKFYKGLNVLRVEARYGKRALKKLYRREVRLSDLHKSLDKVGLDFYHRFLKIERLNPVELAVAKPTLGGLKDLALWELVAREGLDKVLARYGNGVNAYDRRVVRSVERLARAEYNYSRNEKLTEWLDRKLERVMLEAYGVKITGHITNDK